MKRLTLALLFLVAAPQARAGSISQTKHNLSVSGTGSIRSLTEKRTCIFCHVAHGGRGNSSNRPASTTSHRTYRSSTMVSAGGQGVSGSSRTCMSCHDGTVAIGQTLAKGRIQMKGAGPMDRMPTGSSNLGADLSGTHPISFRPQPSAKHHAPAPGDPVKLDQHGLVQCTSCHDPHSDDNDPTNKKFLVKSNRDAALCRSCHQQPGWQSSSHQDPARSRLSRTLSARSTSGMIEGGCGACHQQHGTGGGRLIKGDRAQGDDRICLSCHDGRTATHDLTREVSKPWAHAAPAAGPSGHDDAEGPTDPLHRLPEPHAGVPRHVACVDCHNPHAAFAGDAMAPRAKGVLAGVWGMDRNGQRVDPVNYEYEVCFKCHADSLNQPQARGTSAGESVRRAMVETNLRRLFDTNSPSFHPVIGPGKNSDVPGLISPLTPASIIFCGDCHGSNDAGLGSVPRGPHGSIYTHLLERNYATADRTAESPVSYALCYKCHDRNVLLSDQSAFKLHRRHVVDQGTACATCHNAHGVSSLAATPQSGVHLMDFDLSVVRPNARGQLTYASRGRRAGTCSLSCHGSQHDARAY